MLFTVGGDQKSIAFHYPTAQVIFLSRICKNVFFRTRTPRPPYMGAFWRGSATGERDDKTFKPRAREGGYSTGKGQTSRKEKLQPAEDQGQRPEPIRDGRGPFLFYRQREPPDCRTLPESAQDQGEGPRGYPRRAPTVPAPIYTQGDFSAMPD